MEYSVNFEVAKKLCEMCEYLGLNYIQVRPTRSKLKAETFKAMTKITNGMPLIVSTQ